MFTKRFACFLFIILIFSIGFVSAHDLENQTLGFEEDVMMGDTIVIDNDDYANITTNIKNADDNDTVKFEGERYLSNEFTIDKSITLESDKNRATLYYSTFTINEGSVTIRNLDFFASANTYAIYGYNEKLTIENCYFDHTAPIQFKGGDLTVTNCTFKGSEISFFGNELKVENCSFENTTHSAIYCYANTLNVMNSNFTNYGGLFIDNSSQVNLKNNRFRNTEYGSEIKNSKKVTVENNLFENGGLSISDNEKATVRYNILINSSLSNAGNVELGNCEFISSTLTYISQKPVENCSFINITADYEIFGKINFDNCSFINNTVPYLIGGDGKIENSVFINNTADSLLYGSSTGYRTIESSKFINNKLNNNLFEFDEVKTVNITNCEFINNIASNDILMLFEIKNITISGNLIANNTCKKEIEVRYQDTHIDYDDPITTSQKITNNIFLGNDFTIKLDTIIASNEYNTRSGTKVEIRDNFYARNFKNQNEINVINPITRKDSWVNVNLTASNGNYILKFTNNKGQTVDLHDCYLTLKDKTTGEVIISDIPVKSGQATFKFERKLNPDDIFILDAYSNILNKPYANITYTTSGSNYDDFKITVYVKNGARAIENQTVIYNIDAYYSSGYVDSHWANKIKTDSEGKITIGYWYTFDDSELLYYNVTAIFANEEFGYGELLIPNIRPDKIDAELTLESITIPYSSYKSVPIDLDEITFTPKNSTLKDDTMLIYSVYKNKKLIYTTDIYSYNGKFSIYNPAIRELDVGTYTIVVKNEFGRYKSVKKTATLKITKAKTVVKAPKLTAKYKKSAYFNIDITHKSAKKPVKKTYVNLKIGKNTYKVKTNKKGVAKFNTKKLKVGKYKVKITSASSNYKISAKSTITIKR